MFDFGNRNSGEVMDTERLGEFCMVHRINIHPNQNSIPVP